LVVGLIKAGVLTLAEAVIRTEIVRGEASHPRLVLVRELDPHTSAAAGPNPSR